MPSKPEDIQCPACGYYCLGKGGWGCIDKPFFLRQATDHGATLSETYEMLQAEVDKANDTEKRDG